ncbi:MAG: hypothetical protein AB7P40_07445 [Chloroflexota bacterium]
MKTQITRTLSALALTAALMTGSTAAFAATPATSPAFYDEAGDYTADGLEYGGAALGVGAGVVQAADGDEVEGQATSGGLQIGNTVLTDVAAPIVRIATP